MKIDYMKKLKGIKKAQKTIDALLKTGMLGTVEKPKNDWTLEPLHQGRSCSLGFVHIRDTESGPCAEHIHIDSKEYLIVVSGSVMLNIDGNDVRVLKVGDCGVVGPGQLHYSRPLEDNTKMIYACVPADPGMASLIEELEGNNG